MAPVSQETTVVIVGAGMSGVATAWSLRQAGIESILLEARPRIGGRIDTRTKWKGAAAELGASWVTQGTINPLVPMARAKGIALKDSNLFNISLTEAGGRALSDEEIAEGAAGFFTAYGAVSEEAEKLRRRGKPDTSLAKYFPDAIDALKLSKKKRRIVEFFLNFTALEPYCSNLDDLSLYSWDDDYTRFMLKAFVVPDGYIEFVEMLTKGLDIRLEHVVKKISYDGNGVTVSTLKHGDFHAPYGVVTLPHGVLAAKSVKFAPSLPNWKQAAIDGLHTGLSDKFWFLFPRKFWKSNRDIVGRVDAEGKGRWSTWVNFHRYTKQPVLMCFNRDEHAEVLEKMSDQEVIDEAMKALRAEYGPRTPDPIDMQRSKWLADPFARGTLVHVPPGQTTENHRILGRPVGRLHFAGDSTNAEVPGTVFAAFLSGVREAERIALQMVFGKGGAKD